ncbi:hypothetical protein ACHAXR_006438 [Thalassiosira sp. AJA248-18]
MAAQTETISSIEKQIGSLEKSSWNTKKGSAVDDEAAIITPELRRARRHVQESHCYSSNYKLCPPNYYTLSLDERKTILGAHSTSQLCKACLFENKNFVPNNTTDGNNNKEADVTNSRYYLVVVQYVESINTKKLASELRGLRPPGPKRFDTGYFSDLRLAPEEISEQLTGYGHNGVSPFGMLDRSIPVVVCKSIKNVRPAYVWMGGGHRDWKLGMAVSEFVRGVNGIVLDVSEPRI